MQEILFMSRRNDLHEKKKKKKKKKKKVKKKKKKKKKLQCNNHMDPKKNCIFVNKINWNMHTWKPLSFSE